MNQLGRYLEWGMLLLRRGGQKWDAWAQECIVRIHMTVCVYVCLCLAEERAHYKCVIIKHCHHLLSTRALIHQRECYSYFIMFFELDLF